MDDRHKKAMQEIVKTAMAFLKKAQEKLEDATTLESDVRCFPCTSGEVLDGMKPLVVVEPQAVEKKVASAAIVTNNAMAPVKTAQFKASKLFTTPKVNGGVTKLAQPKLMIAPFILDRIKQKLAAIVKEKIAPKIVGDFSSEFITNVKEGKFGSYPLDVPLDLSMIKLGFETPKMTFNKQKIQITVPYTCSSVTEHFKVDTLLSTLAHIRQVKCREFLVRFSKEADLSVFSVMSTDDADAFNTIWIANKLDEKIEIGFLGSDTTYKVDDFNDMFMSFFMMELGTAIQHDTSVFTRIMEACEEATTSADT
jgi:hypothetical protein